MHTLLKELRSNPVLWLLFLVPVVLIAAKVIPGAHTLLFILSVLAIVPLAALLSHATESVAERTGDTLGGLLNATLGNLTELVIAAAALRAGEYALVKGSIAGAIVTNTLFMLGASFLLGGLKHHVQQYNRATARLDAALLFLATIALVSPSAIAKVDLVPGAALTHELSVALAMLLIVGYGLGLLFSLKTHREIFAGAEHVERSEPTWPIGLGLGTLAVVTLLVALVSEIFVESVQKAAEAFGMSQAFVGFIVVALVGGAAEMAVAFSAARKDRLDLSVGIALGSASQIALFVGPVLVLLSYVIGPTPMDLEFWPGAVVMVFVATLVAAFITSGGRSAWFVGVLLLLVYAIFAVTLYLWPPAVYAARNDYEIVAVFSDRAMTGSSFVLRRGVQAMLQAARAGQFDFVIAESLSRLARDQEDAPAIRKRLEFAGVKIVTTADGVVSPLMHGLRTIIDSQYLDDLKSAVRRGMSGVIRDGRHAGGALYGYRSVPGRPGELEIVPEQAEIIRRIFREYVAGDVPRAIAGRLNGEGMALSAWRYASPRGRKAPGPRQECHRVDSSRSPYRAPPDPRHFTPRS